MPERGQNPREALPTRHQDRTPCRVSVIDEDPLRARREMRELLHELSGTDPSVTLDIPRSRATRETDKGGPTAEVVALVFSGSSLLVAGVQTWLARVPQRTVIATRPDGATLRITGREARADNQRVERFLAGEEDGDQTRGGSPETDEDNGPAAD